MAKLGQTKRTVMIELALVLALTIIIAYSRISRPVPAATHLSASPLIATPAPVPSRTLSAIPVTKPVQVKTKILHQVAKSALAGKPVPVPSVAGTIQEAPEPATVPAPNEALVPAHETTMVASVAKPEAALDPAPVPDSKGTSVTVSEPAPVAVSNEALTPVPEPATVPGSKEALATVPEPAPVRAPKALQTPKIPPAQALPIPTNSTPTAKILVAGAVAAMVLAPIAAPLSVVVGITVGIASKIKTWQ